ncbi:SRR1-like protein isoform X2 [Erinaceus europaeus]|uniref:SRR1-like protein isoform X2 n=1 Tax=Erinaceus europaeus TaxID=9365 RepID=A0ABM3XIF2_ERIEU|nr:SRR1-like protein isoform X2 [Erinaceus europaeus]
MAAAELGSWRSAPSRRRGAGRRRARLEAAAATREPEADLEGDVESVLRRIREAEKDLLLSDFWSSAQKTLQECLGKRREQAEAATGNLPEAPGELCSLQCVSYGIGSFASCAVARSQLAFLLLFLEKFQVPRHRCWVYDPVFSPREVAVLQALGVNVLNENEEGKRGVWLEPTVFYMPHCGTALYNNLLWRNWLLTRILRNHYPYVAKVLDATEELALPQTPRYEDVFNDTSVHWFPLAKLRGLPTAVWMSREEPDYRDCEDLEIIRNEARGPEAAPSTP